MDWATWSSGSTARPTHCGRCWCSEPRPSCRAAHSLPFTEQLERTQPVTTAPMVPVKIGGETFYVPAAVSAELEYRRGLADAHAASRATTQPVAGTAAPAGAHSFADAARLSARDALRAQEARNNDPNTAQGK